MKAIAERFGMNRNFDRRAHQNSASALMCNRDRKAAGREGAASGRLCELPKLSAKYPAEDKNIHTREREGVAARRAASHEHAATIHFYSRKELATTRHAAGSERTDIVDPLRQLTPSTSIRLSK